jgi:hypothetical protein
MPRRTARTVVVTLAIALPAIVPALAADRYQTSILVVPLARTEGGDNEGVNVKFGPPSVPFDIDGDGTTEMVAFPEPGSGAWLVIDLNGNGVIDNGREMFGENTGGKTYPSAFEAVAEVAPHFTDGVGDSRVLLWSDVSIDGISQPEELQPASNVLIAVGTGYTMSRKRDQFGTYFRYQGFAPFTKQDDVRPVYVVVPFVIR